jgi:hypothetical protein
VWRKFIVSADKEEWEGVWDDLIEACTHADEFLLTVKGNKLMWLMHKVKAQYHHSRDFLVTGSVPCQRARLMTFFRNCGEILQRERAASEAAAENQNARKRLTSDEGRLHLDEYARLISLFFAPRHRDAVQRYLRKSDTRQQLDARQAATFNNTIARIYLNKTNMFALPSWLSEKPTDAFYGINPNSENINFGRDPMDLQAIWADIRSE